MQSWIRKLLSSPRPQTNRKNPARSRLRFDSLEERIAPAGGLVYAAVSQAPLTLRLSGNTIEVVNSTTSGVLASKALADNIQPQPRSGKQELLENVVNRYV